MSVGLYGNQLVPRVNNMICGSKTLSEFRGRACAGLTGEVVEVGFGSGLNVPFYPAAVTAVVAVEPSDVAWGLAAKRIQAAKARITRAGIDGESLPFDEATFDSALTTWTLCTIPDVALALRELRRVLRPGGQLHFLDHGLAPDERVRKWQRRLDPLQQRLAGGCHFTRPITELITAAGFTITSLDEFYVPGPKVGGADSLGVAVSPAP